MFSSVSGRWYLSLWCPSSSASSVSPFSIAMFVTTLWFSHVAAKNIDTEGTQKEINKDFWAARAGFTSEVIITINYYAHFTDEITKAQKDQADLSRVAQLVNNGKDSNPGLRSSPFHLASSVKFTYWTLIAASSQNLPPYFTHYLLPP